MTTLAWFDTALFTRIVLTFGHFLWEGAAIALIVLVLSVVLRNSSARLRYVFFLAALMLMTICPVVTFWFVQAAESGPALTQPGEPTLAGESDTLGFLSHESTTVKAPAADGFDILAPDEILAADAQPGRMGESSSEQATLSSGEAQAGSRWQWVVPYLAVVYLLGVILLLGRLLLGLHGGHHLRRQAQLIDEPELLSAIARSTKMLGMRFTPTILYCKQVAIPTVVGVFRPAILLPLSLTTGLSPDQVEAVLTHELAHVRRYDHLVNILQRVIESLLFFHPAVWWVSHRICVERENCCDDIVLALGAEPLGYAASLLDIAERARVTWPSPKLEAVASLHAAKSGSVLSHRIKRLVSGSSGDTLRLTRGGLVLTLVCLAFLAFGGVLLQGQTESDARKNETQEKDEPKNTDGKATKDGRNGPRAVVAKWLDLVRADNIRDSWVLTTKSVDLDAQDDLKRLWNKDKIRIERSLGNDSVAVVVTNTVKDNSGRDRAFAFWLVRRDGMWLINVSYLNDPEDIEQQLRGFFTGGNVHWHVATEDIVGSWSAGPGFVVPIQYQFESNGTFSRQMRDSGGKLTERGTWRLEKDLLIREQDEHRTVSQVVWLRKDLFQLEASDGKSRTGYRREKIAKKQSSNTRSDTSTPRRPQSSDRDAGGEVKKGDLPGNAQSAPAIDASNRAKATKTVYVPAVDSEGKNVLLDLTSGNMLPNSPEVNGPPLTRFGNGYLFYKGDLLGLLHGAKAMIWNKDRFVPFKSAEQMGKITAYKLPRVPCRLLVTTATKRQFDLTILSETKDGGIVLEYHAAAEAPAKPTVNEIDRKRLQGAWKVLSVKKNGDPLPEIDGKYVFHPDRFQIFNKGKEVVSGTYSIGPSRNPKTIDLHSVSQPRFPKLMGIYEFPAPGRLRICYGDKQTWRPTSFDSKQDGGNVAVLELRLETADVPETPTHSDRPAVTPTIPDKGKGSDEANKKVHLRNAEGGPGAKIDDFLGVKFILDLASGEMLAFPDDVLKAPGHSGQFLTNQKRGDLFYAGRSLFCLRGARAMQWDGKSFVPMEQGDFAASSAQPAKHSSVAAAKAEADVDEKISQGEVWVCSMHPQVRLPKTGKCPICGMDLIPFRGKSTGGFPTLKGTQNLVRYELTTLPCRLLITTAEKKRFDVTVVSEAVDGGIDLEYSKAVGTLDTQKSVGDAPETVRTVIRPARGEIVDQGSGIEIVSNSVGETIYAKELEKGSLKTQQDPSSESTNTLKTSSVALRRLSAKGNVQRWRVEPTKEVRILQGTVDIIGSRDGSRSFIGRQGVGGRRLTHSHPFELRVETRREGRYLWINTMLGDSHRNEATAMETRFDFPRGSRMQIVPWNARGDWSEAPRLTTDEYANLWEARFVRDGKVVRSYVFVTRLIGEDEVASTTPFQPRLPAASAMPAADPTAPATPVLAEAEKKVPAGAASSDGDAENKTPPAKAEKVSEESTKTAHLPSALQKSSDGNAITPAKSDKVATEAPEKSTASDTDHEPLRGVWKVLSAKENGRVLPEKDGQFVFQSGRFQIFEDGKQQEFGSYTIDPSRNPKTIDLHTMSKRKRRVSWGIYDFPREGRLRICFGYNRTGHPPARPTNFDSVRGIPYLRVLEFQLETRDASAAPKSSDPNATTPAKTDKAATKTPAGSAETVTDHERLQGAWNVFGGKKKGRAPPEVGAQFVLQSGRFQIHDDNLDGTNELFGTYTIDPSRSPKTIDFQFVSIRELPMLPAIYEFPGEGRLRICFGPDKTGRPTRPTSFDSKQGNVTVLELQLETGESNST